LAKTGKGERGGGDKREKKIQDHGLASPYLFEKEKRKKRGRMGAHRKLLSGRGGKKRGGEEGGGKRSCFFS